jgi:hypothetical protein
MSADTPTMQLVRRKPLVMAKKQLVQPPCLWLTAQNALIGESVVVENASHFVKLKTYKPACVILLQIPANAVVV